MELNIPTGIPLIYEFKRDFAVIGKNYLADESILNAKMDVVINQGKAK